MRRELKWESTLAHLQQQLGLLKGEGTTENAAAAAEGQAKQLSTIRQVLLVLLLVPWMCTVWSLSVWHVWHCALAKYYTLVQSPGTEDGRTGTSEVQPANSPILVSLEAQRHQRVSNVMVCNKHMCVNPTPLCKKWTSSSSSSEQYCRELHKEVMAGIDEAVSRHAQETDKVDLATLKQLKHRLNALEEQVSADRQRQLSVISAPPCTQSCC